MKPEKFYLERLNDGSWRNFKGLLDHLEGLPNGRWVVEVKKYQKTRSNEENRFYWGYFVQSQIDCFTERWGEVYNKQAVHDWNKLNFWGEERVLNEETGEVIRTPATSTDKTTWEWEQKLEVMRSWFLQHMDWPLPFTNEQGEMF